MILYLGLSPAEIKNAAETLLAAANLAIEYLRIELGERTAQAPSQYSMKTTISGRAEGIHINADGTIEVERLKGEIAREITAEDAAYRARR